MKINKIIEFRDQLKKIPSENVISGEFTNCRDSCCVIGHFQRLNSKDPSDYGIGNCQDDDGSRPFRGSFRNYVGKRLVKIGINVGIAGINNQETTNYMQKSPKARSLACLNDLIKTLKSEK